MTMKESLLKFLDCITYSLIMIGALNWGLVGFFKFDVIAAFCGPMSALSRIVYATVGVAALYDVLSLRSMIHRWDVHLHHHAVPAHA
jgi:uncharacterized membrane protein YuzA (DUF378 family)